VGGGDACGAGQHVCHASLTRRGAHMEPACTLHTGHMPAVHGRTPQHEAAALRPGAWGGPRSRCALPFWRQPPQLISRGGACEPSSFWGSCSIFVLYLCFESGGGFPSAPRPLRRRPSRCLMRETGLVAWCSGSGRCGRRAGAQQRGAWGKTGGVGRICPPGGASVESAAVVTEKCQAGCRPGRAPAVSPLDRTTRRGCMRTCTRLK
jgi:hypothetical protein